MEFDIPERDPDVIPDDRFELGLVLAGAVSAGAYVAGVMDFLFEALEAWQSAKDSDTSGAVPGHEVLIRVITGTSGGGMNGAITAAVLDRRFPHVTSENSGRETGNPFFDAWVNEIDISILLALRDLSGDSPKIESILDSSELDLIARRALTTPPGASQIKRPYFANPLRLFLTATNLRGVPYWMAFTGNTDHGHGMNMHRDHLRFAVKQNDDLTAETPFPDVLPLTPAASPVDESWSELASAALATGAFPSFLKARQITRNSSDYDFRNVLRNLENNKGGYTAVQPSKSDLWDDAFAFPAVDGGTMNNEPLELARQVLAGAYGRNPRDGLGARRATVMIDPFPEMPDGGPADTSEINPVSSFLALTEAWKSEARFRAQDLALAVTGNTYSRFLIAPSRRGGMRISNNHSLTSEALGAFGGFLSRHFRLHDFLLGRRNCQRFLSHNLILPEGHKLFDSWNGALKQTYLVAKNNNAGGVKDHLPVIPLIKGSKVATREEPMPAWPSGLFDRASIEPLLEARFDALYEATTVKMDIPWWQKVYLIPLKRAVRRKLMKSARRKIAETLDGMNL